MSAPARSGIASLEVLQEKFNMRLQALVLAGLGAATFIFAVATLGLINSYFGGEVIAGDFVWLTILSIATAISFGVFAWRYGDGARSTQFAPNVWYPVVLVVFAIMWFAAAIAPLSVTGYTDGVVLYCSRIIGTFAACGTADVTEVLTWIIFVLLIVSILTVVGQGQKYSSFKTGAGIPLSNVEFTGVQTGGYNAPPAGYDGRVFTPPPEGHTGMYAPPPAGTPTGTPTGTFGGGAPPQFPQYDNNAYAPPPPPAHYDNNAYAPPPPPAHYDNNSYASSSPSLGYASQPPTQEYASPSLSYASPPPTQGYASPSPSLGYASPPPTHGYVSPPPPQGYASPSPSLGYAAPSHTQGYAPPPQGYGGNVYTPPEAAQEYNQGNVHVPAQTPNTYERPHEVDQPGI